MSNRRNWIAALTVLANVAWLSAGLAKANGADALPTLSGTELTDLVGQRHKLAGNPELKLSVLVFLGTQCPVSNGYAPALRRLHDSYANSGVRMYGIHCDPDVSAQTAQTHARDYELTFPLVLDHQQRLAQACGVHTVPTAVVIGADGQVLYRGRIDNRYVAIGQRRPEATSFDLQLAIEAALAGQMPSPATTEPVGCPLPSLRR